MELDPFVVAMTSDLYPEELEVLRTDVATLERLMRIPEDDERMHKTMVELERIRTTMQDRMIRAEQEKAYAECMRIDVLMHEYQTLKPLLTPLELTPEDHRGLRLKSVDEDAYVRAKRRVSYVTAYQSTLAVPQTIGQFEAWLVAAKKILAMNVA